jgi:proline iminopeptidase
MPPATGGLFEQVRARLPETSRPEYDAYLKRYLDFRNVFSQSEADLVALNEEFVGYYAAALPTTHLPAGGQAGGWMVQAVYFSMGQRHDYRAALAAVTAPVLVIHGANDLQPESASRLYAQAFPNARFEVIEYVFALHDQAHWVRNVRADGGTFSRSVNVLYIQ